MNGNGVSKKVTILMLAINSVVGLAGSAEDKWPYAIVVGVMFIAYVTIRAFTERNTSGKEIETPVR